jgi:hypothetical protein
MFTVSQNRPDSTKKSRRWVAISNSPIVDGRVFNSNIQSTVIPRLVVDEYGNTISEVVSERDRERVVHEIAMEKITNQRNQVVEDLKSAERAFNDVHRKYERTKEVITEFKRNEDRLKVAVHDLGGKTRKAEDRYELLKSHAESKLSE